MSGDDASAQLGAVGRLPSGLPRVARRTGLAAAAILIGLWALPGVRALVGDNFHLVIPDQVLRSGQLSDPELKRVVERHSIRSVINLRGSHPGEPWYDSERAVSWPGSGWCIMTSACRRIASRIARTSSS